LPAALALALATVVLAVACTPGGTATATPGAEASSSGPAPKPTRWPTLTIEAAIALGAAHSDFTKMVNDVALAVDAEDPERIVVAMDDALEFLAGNQTNIPRLQSYDSTKSVGDRLGVVYEAMIEGATEVRDGLTSGDANAVESGFQKFFEGSTEYTTVAGDLVDLAEQAVFMKRILLN